jgi:hypothetical protein
MVIDFLEPGGPGSWLDGSQDLPSTFPENPNNAWITLYFTDEGDWVRNVEASILTIAPGIPIPEPGAGLLLATAAGLAGWSRRARR